MDDQRREDRDLPERIRQQQHTGNHEGGADRFGGTRAGAENLEHPQVGDRQPTDPEAIEASDLPERDKQYGTDDN